MNEFLAPFTSAAQEIIKKALYNEDDQSGNYTNGWWSKRGAIDLINSTVNSDSESNEASHENMDSDSPATSFNRKSASEVTRKINEIFKVDEERLFTRSFQKEFLKRCIYDIDTRESVDFSQLNVKLYEWKHELWTKLKQELKLDSISWTENPSSEDLTNSINNILMLIESMIDNINLSDSLKENLYFLSKMDSLLQSTGCVERDSTLKPFEHSRTMYSFGTGHVRMYKNWSKNEEAGIEENSSPLLKFLIETLPCAEGSEKDSEDSYGLYIATAINNFSSLFVQDFVLKHPNIGLRQAVLNGLYSEGLFNFLESPQAIRQYNHRYENRTLLYEEDRILVINRMLELLYAELLTGIYGDTPSGAKLKDKYKDAVHGTFKNRKSEHSYQTSIRVLHGLRKHVFTDDGKGIRTEFKKLLLNQM